MKLPNVRIGLSGMFMVRAKDCKTGRTRIVADWFPNLITNNGLDLLAADSGSWSAGILDGVAVGSGSSSPSNSDTQMQSLVAFTNNVTSGSDSIETSERYFRRVQEWTFGVGEAAGNISEIGVGATSTNLFSRALVLDSGGSPTTITILENEVLIVTYELRCYQPTNDFISTVDGYDVVLRSANVNSSNSSIGWDSSPMEMGPVAQACSGSISSITSRPGGGVSSNSISDDSYIPGSYTRTGSFYFGTATANFTINAFEYKLGPGFFQFSVDPPITKQNTDELTVAVRITWARQGELPS